MPSFIHKFLTEGNTLMMHETEFSTEMGPPELFNIQAEQELLGALLIKNEVYDRVSGILSEGQFYDPLHSRIFEAIKLKIEGGQIANPVTLKSQFQNEEPLGDVTVPAYLGRLLANATSIYSSRDYAATIAKMATRRELVNVSNDIAGAAYDLEQDASSSDLIEQAESRLHSIEEPSKHGAGFRSFGDAAHNALESAGEAFSRKGGLAGLSTGIHTLDSQTGGLCNSDLIILAGRPSMGKTALATNIAFNVAQSFRRERKNGVVAFFSLEMSDEQLASRIISSSAKVSSERIRRGKITNDEFKRLTDKTRELEALPLHIDQSGGLSIGQLQARARKLNRQQGVELIIVDYLQLLSGSSRTGQGRVNEVTEITVGLKALAKELNVPIIALSQLSRQVENREDKRPMLSDLRESGSIEQDADVVMFVYREEYYISKQQPEDSDTMGLIEWRKKMAPVAGLADVITAKQRHGPTGIVRLGFEGQFTQFYDVQNEGACNDPI